MNKLVVCRFYFCGEEGEIDAGHPGPRASRAVAKALRRPKSLLAILSNSLIGGEGEIRTHEGCETLPVFKTDHPHASPTHSHANAIITDIMETCPVPRFLGI
jgi:hypothetical protein